MNSQHEGFLLEIKKFLIRLYLIHYKRRRQQIFKFDSASKNAKKAGIVATEEQWFLEKCRPLQDAPRIADTVEFGGIDNKGNALSAHMTRLHHRTAEICIYLKLSSGDEYQSIIHPDMRMVNVDSKRFSAGGLTFEVLDPLRAWRIIFRGILRKGIRNDWDSSSQDEVDVCFNFIWHPEYHPFAMNENFNISMLTDKIKELKAPWKFLSELKLNPDEQLEQWGQMFGTYQIDGQDDVRLNLWTVKIRSYGIRNSSPKLRVHLHAKDGSVLSFQTQPDFHGLQNVTNGYVVRASNFGRDTISKINMNSARIFDSIPLDSLDVKFTARDHEYSLKISAENYGYSLVGREPCPRHIRAKIVKGMLNNFDVTGFLEISQPYTGTCSLPKNRESVPLLKEIDVANVKGHVLRLVDPSCRNSNLVGGKGASLALMMTIKTDEDKFEVPSGVCLTKDAFSMHISENVEIYKAILVLENVAWKRIEGSIQQSCERVIDTVLKSKLSSVTQRAIQEELSYTFTEKYEQIPFAVRSSAIGEDGDEVSAAGQNETFLGVIGFANICEAVLKCWASQFSFRSVEYKRRNGQLLNGGMAVVIQQMIPSDVSGVTFTVHPRAGQFGYVVITANYGLGESVVSASADPDTYILRRSWDDKLKIHEKILGKKKLKTVAKNDGGITEETTDVKDATSWCLSDELALKLGRVGVLLDQSYGNPRDIEWSIRDNRLYLLQCRPITTHLQPTEFEIYHEFDSSRLTEEEHYTRANVGEVMPGALTPLTISTLTRRWMIISQYVMAPILDRFWFNPIISHGLGSVLYCNQFLNDRVFQKLFGLSEKPSPTLQAFQLGLYGRVIDETDVHQKAVQRFPLPGFSSSLKTFYNSFIKALLFGPWMLKRIQHNFQNYSVNTSGVTSAEQLHETLENSAFDGMSVFLAHIAVSTGSMIWNLLLLNSLAGAGKEYTLDDYHDFAVLIGNSIGAVSGEVPLAFKELGKCIKEHKDPKEFASMTPEVALHWLKSHPVISVKFSDFMKKHGHRGHKEFELSATPWRMIPLKLVDVLQKMVVSPPQPEQEKQDDTQDIFAKLKTPPTFIKRKLLAFVYPRCRNAVISREQSKTILIKMSDAMREGYLKLGEMLVNEGRICEPTLIFFFTHEEIGRLIKTRSASLVNRAMRRQRAFPYMDALRFSEFIDGEPKTIDEEEAERKLNMTSELEDENVTKITAYPIYHGIAKGPARVIVKFADIDQIKPGDILITHSTDIAWSPYFPILAGVVTEIGGLISHGAVVAREYGLPCIIAAEGATKIFKSGEMVLLDASKGILQKISE